MTTLNFALSRVAGRDLAGGRRDPRERARPRRRRRAVGRARRRPRARGPHGRGPRRLHLRRRRPGAAALGADADRRVRLGVERRRHRRRRGADLRPRAGGRGAVVDRRRPLRRARADRRRASSAATSCSARRTSSAGRTSASRTCAASWPRRWRPYKARPSATSPVGRRFETGTPPYELLAGVLGDARLPRVDRRDGARSGRTSASSASGSSPASTSASGSSARRRWTTACRRSCSPSTASTRRTRPSELAERGLGVWHADNWYCLGLVDRLPPRSLRVGFIHYNTPDEVDRLLAELAALAA